jgi:hypothetical protein
MDMGAEAFDSKKDVYGDGTPISSMIHIGSSSSVLWKLISFDTCTGIIDFILLIRWI